MCVWCVCFFQAEDGIRDLVRSRGLGDVYKRQDQRFVGYSGRHGDQHPAAQPERGNRRLSGTASKPLSLIHI